MTRIHRRRFLAGTGAVVFAGGLPRPALAQAKPRVIVIGGGPGGATAAKYIAKDSNGAIEVTLVEPQRAFTTCFHSNLFLGGFRDWASITHSYDKLASGYGVRLVHQAVAAIDRNARTIRLADGSEMGYDRLVVAPGIDLRFDSVPGYSEEAAEVMPHAWKAGPQTQLLKKQLDALADGSLIVMVAPPNPYRCPPGPYERVSMMAHVLKAKGHKTSRIVVLDPKDSFSKQGLFQEGWERHYPGMVEWQDPKMHGGIKGVDASAMTVRTDLETYKAALVNVIPAQMAGKIARDAGLANQTGWCPVDPASMKSASDPNVYVVGDACLHPGRHAEIGVLGEQPGQGRGHDGARRARPGPDLPGPLHQHLLEPDRDRRHREGRRRLRGEGRQDRRGLDLRLAEGRDAGGPAADAGREHGLVRRLHGRRIRVSGSPRPARARVTR
jgi:sulfide dehydrogenase [flavocytochrome c] flavoprotein subunit